MDAQELEVSFWTLLLYEEEFNGRDLIADMCPVDGRIPHTTLIRALWACRKAADDSVPPLKEWAKSMTRVNMPDVLKVVVPAINDGLFLQAPAEA